MAVIDGKVPPPTAAETAPTVVVKLSASTGAAAPAHTLTFLDRPESEALAILRRHAPRARFDAYATHDPAADERTHAVLTRYARVQAPDRPSAERLAEALNTLPEVEIAYVPGGPTPPPVNPADDPRSASQGYLNAAPGGIDARWAWTGGLADGSGIDFVDCERGWTLDHEDLVNAHINVISGVSQDYQGHGTAVLGEVVAVDNAKGCIGIAPAARARVVSQWRTATTYDTALAILSAAANMRRGDVLLLEAQTTVGSSDYLPVEVEQAAFDAIRHAVDAGITVIEAGANGSTDLDGFRNAANRRVLDRSSSDFRDSGAIMVGAASSAAPHVRLDFSNFGSRIDCYAWGEGVNTLGDGWTGISTTAYTAGFGGTSGASPIVAGAAVLLQSWRWRRHRQVFDPGIVRARLSSAALNTASANPAADRIGVMPNMRAIIEAELRNDRFRFDDHWRALTATILFGVTNDGGGVVWIPGRGPVPVDPWGPLVELGPAKRDLITALAMSEMAGLLQDGATRTALSKAAAEAMRAAVDRIEPNART